MKYVIFKGTGGLAHMLKMLSQIITIAKEENRYIAIFCKNINFCDYFKIEDASLQYTDKCDIFSENAKFKGLPIQRVKDLRTKYTKKGYFLHKTNIPLYTYKKQDKIIVLTNYGGGGSWNSNFTPLEI